MADSSIIDSDSASRLFQIGLNASHKRKEVLFIAQNSPFHLV